MNVREAFLRALLLSVVIFTSSIGLASDPNDPNNPTMPVLAVSKTVISFMAYLDGSNPVGQTFTVSNSGIETLSWMITDANEPTFNPPAWLTITPISGGPLAYNQSTTVTVSAAITGLAAGTYSYAFQVSATGASRSPRTVTVSLQVTGPVLWVSKSSVSFSCNEDGSNPASRTVTVRNIGGGILNWAIDTSNTPDWLTITPLSGGPLAYNQNATVTLAADASGLSEGLYSCELNVEAGTALNSPRTILVYLRVGSISVPGMYPTIQAAIDAAFQVDVITVAPGMYYENINFKGKNIVLRSIEPENPEVAAATIINGGHNTSVVTFSGSEQATCILKGFTLINGRVTDHDVKPGGGGICGKGTFATIKYCIITGNTGSRYGGGVHDCDGSISNCTISGNTADECGGGLYACDGSIKYCTISGNTARYGGGVDGCNRIQNCLIVNNTAITGGGLYYCHTVIKSTIADNTANTGPALFYCGTLYNCILWDHSGYGWKQAHYSCIENWTNGGIGNISDDPLFASVDSNNPDYHLKSQYGRWNSVTKQWMYDDVTSPCIDAGGIFYEDSTDPNSWYHDWHNELWPHGGRINMGAYGGTPEASLSPDSAGSAADLNHDEYVDANDLMLLAEDWLLSEHLLDTDLNRDGKVDLEDFAAFADLWLR